MSWPRPPSSPSCPGFTSATSNRSTSTRPRTRRARAARRSSRHEPLHFHEFFHYYLGSKYFNEVGYLGLYDCTALGDLEIAREDDVSPRIGGTCAISATF